MHFLLELFPECKKLTLAVVWCEGFAPEQGKQGRHMVIGVVFSGVGMGLATAIAFLVAGHPIETTLLAYMTAGLIGAVSFIGMASRTPPELRR